MDNSLVSLDQLVAFPAVADMEQIGPASDLRDGHLFIEPEILSDLAERALAECSFYLPSEQLQAYNTILLDEEASEGERFVAQSMIRNAIIASAGIYPLCQDTGVALVYAWKGDKIWSASSDEEALARGVGRAYTVCKLRASVLAPKAMLQESIALNNLPAHIDIRNSADSEQLTQSYRLCFAAKGGGSMNRLTLSMETPALLQEEKLQAYLHSLVNKLGTSGCPPYRLATVIGGVNPEETLYVQSLAALGLLDAHPGRDLYWENKLIQIARDSGIGAQFGGNNLLINARVIRLARHAASLPIAHGIFCSAFRRVRAVINNTGVYIEKLEKNPARFLPQSIPLFTHAVHVNFDASDARGMRATADKVTVLNKNTQLLISGYIIVARDKAHARWQELIARGAALPDYLLRYPIFYAGPSPAQDGQVSGSFGPTTAGRMDSFMEELLQRGAALVTIAKGGRSPAVYELLKKYRGAYLASIGGVAALFGSVHILESTVIDYPELGMEAVRLVRVKDLPAIVVASSR